MHRSIVFASFLLLLALIAPSTGDAQPRRAIRTTDIYRIRDIGEPRISPDGQWIAYTVSTVDSAKDKSDSDVWMVSWDGTRNAPGADVRQ